MLRVFMILVLCIGLVAIGCNKKQDELDAIEQEAVDEDLNAVMDSLEGAGSEGGEAASGYQEEEVSPIIPEQVVAESEPAYSQIEGFVVQLGSYKNYELAQYWAEKYQNRELPAFIREMDMEGQTYYRLRVGVYDTYQEADDVGKMLVDRYSATYWIDNNR